jgi:lipoprotein-anchoring transpeptidase ErfK/SrfK
VRLPWRPNGAEGWLRAGAVSLHATQWRLEISRRGRTITVYRGGLRVKEFAVVVGKASTPTPVGLYSILGVWRGDPAGFSGAWILTLSAHSDALLHFEGGNGRVAIHGRGGASLLDPLGSARSHGCIRLANPAIDWLVRQVGAAELPGVPVTVGP